VSATQRSQRLVTTRRRRRRRRRPSPSPSRLSRPRRDGDGDASLSRLSISTPGRQEHAYYYNRLLLRHLGQLSTSPPSHNPTPHRIVPTQRNARDKDPTDSSRAEHGTEAMAREEQEQEQSTMGDAQRRLRAVSAHVGHQTPAAAGGCGLAANPAAAEYAHGTYAALPLPGSLPHLSSGVRNACGGVTWGGVGWGWVGKGWVLTHKQA